MKEGTWTFNEETAVQFDTIARSSIPHYEEVIEKSLGIALALFPVRDQVKIIDVGSATGYTMARFRDAGFSQMYGVDDSPAMLRKSRVQEHLILSKAFPKDRGPYDMVLANWTLHFIRERKAYLQDIYDALAEDGVLLLTDKMQTSGFVHDRYHDFKRSMGLSEEHIAYKAAAIQGVLIPYPL